MTATSTTASDLARQTPSSRDRYVDFLRLFSIAVVVLGHWLMAVVTWRGHEFNTGNAIALTPYLWIATWFLQVMPIFFFVGGFSNLLTVDGLRRKGQGATEFVASRIARLLKPVAILLAAWVPFAFVLEALGLDSRVLRSATKLVCQPLWFIGVYLAVTALAPAMRSLHACYGVRALGALALGIVTVDVVRFGIGINGLGYCNVLFVWLFAQQLGFFYGDGTLLRLGIRTYVAVAGGALATLAALTTFGPYPQSMVGLPGDRISNMSPPTACLFVLTIFEVAIVMLARPVVTRWLARERLWTGVVFGNGVIMTIFLWHLTAALLAVGALHLLGAPQPAGGTGLWWITRPIWLACAAVPLVGFIAVFARFERPRPSRYEATSAYSPVVVGIGVALLAIVVFGVACSNLADILANKQFTLAVVPVTPVQLLIGALLGSALVDHAARRVAL
jgi:hypothetical protein